MDIRKVKKLIEMLESSELEEIEIHEGEESVRLVKNKTETLVTHQVQPNQLDKAARESSEQLQESAPLIENSEGEVITSPSEFSIKGADSCSCSELSLAALSS